MTAPDAGAELIRGRLMKASLGALLDRVRGSRDALPHLAALETSLGRKGAAAIDAIPEHWRARLCAQLCSLPLPADDAPLLDLRQRLTAPVLHATAALPARPKADKAAPQAAPPAPPAPPRARDSDFDPERTVVVRELTHSEFMNLTDGQDPGQEPGPGDADAPTGKPREGGAR